MTSQSVLLSKFQMKTKSKFEGLEKTIKQNIGIIDFQVKLFEAIVVGRFIIY